ncbi:MAG: hypothetical protein ACK4KT_01800 [Thermaurantimonas sp.]
MSLDIQSIPVFLPSEPALTRYFNTFVSGRSNESIVRTDVCTSLDVNSNLKIPTDIDFGEKNVTPYMLIQVH